jgi:hypothetical protein
VTAIEYVPGATRPSKSSGWTNPYAVLHEPRLAPATPDSTVVPLALRTLNGAPVALAGAIR